MNRHITKSAGVVLIIMLIALFAATAIAVDQPVYHGNIMSKVFHLPGCAYYDCDNCSAIFNSREEAVRAGYKPCKKCDP